MDYLTCENENFLKIPFKHQYTYVISYESLLTVGHRGHIFLLFAPREFPINLPLPWSVSDPHAHLSCRQNGMAWHACMHVIIIVSTRLKGMLILLLFHDFERNNA